MYYQQGEVMGMECPICERRHDECATGDGLCRACFIAFEEWEADRQGKDLDEWCWIGDVPEEYLVDFKASKAARVTP